MKTPIINLIGIFVHSHSLKMGTWLPVGSKSSLPNNSRLKIANKHYVVWNNPKTFQWSLLRDACPHRLAPLSQGRVDAETGCIECPYHGWQFSTTGDCNNIPQSADNEIGQNVESINIIETGDILWWDLEYHEVDVVHGSQYWSGRNPDTNLGFTEGEITEFGYSVSIVCDTHVTRRNRLNLVEVRSGGVNTEYQLPRNL